MGWMAFQADFSV